MPKICPYCGYTNPDVAIYCARCGKRLQIQQPIQQFYYPTTTNLPVKALIILGFDGDWNPKSVAITNDRIITWDFKSDQFKNLRLMGITTNIAITAAINMALGLLGFVYTGGIGKSIANSIKQKKIKGALREAMRNGPINLLVTDPNVIRQIPIPGVTANNIGHKEMPVNKVKRILITSGMNDEFIQTNMYISGQHFSQLNLHFLTIPPQQIIQILTSTSFAPFIQVK